MLGFHLSTRSCRRSLCWIGPHIGSNRISRRGSKIQSKKTHQHHHHPKMEDGSTVTQRKPVMVDPRNIPTYDLSAQAMQKIETLYIFSHFFCVCIGCFILSLESCRVTYGLYAGVHYSWSWISTMEDLRACDYGSWDIPAEFFRIICILLVSISPDLSGLGVRLFLVFLYQNQGYWGSLGWVIGSKNRRRNLAVFSSKCSQLAQSI